MSNEFNAALKAASVQLDDVCRECGCEATVSYPVIGGLDVGYCEAHDPERQASRAVTSREATPDETGMVIGADGMVNDGSGRFYRP